MEDSQSDSQIFSVRIVSIDYYMAPPIPGMDFCYSSFQGGKVNEVPVVRVYGATPAGQKTCLHVHRALPYLYIPCSDLLLQPEQGDHFSHSVALAVEKGLKLKGNNAGTKRQHVHGYSLVRARKFYGYHQPEELFLKIYFYFPQDVSRAANLLLAGAVLDKILQPHESHIPFLLQFLIDYNLYGMGHLHLAETKFRHPVPDVFSSRMCGGHRPQPDTFTCADSGNDACSGSPIWLSSTIPDGWMWQYSSQVDNLMDQDIFSVKRQSICELEADASVDDIINQRSKSFLSLSQTRPEVNLVQSLIPIWEEEFERTGILQSVLHCDFGKPLPVDVLITLTDGLEFQNKLLQLYSDAENSSSCSPSENYATLVRLGQLDDESEGATALRCSKACDSINFVLSNDLSLQDKCVSTKDMLPEQVQADELQASDTFEPSDIKTTDQEALGLLKWLASSQAAEDINSEDELTREIILSPLCPSATIDKVLEKANIDYETESQKECQDILDSVEDLMKFNVMKEKKSPSLSHKIIPQVDGSSDDQCVHSSADKSLLQKKKNKLENSPINQVHSASNLKFSSEHKRQRPLWGSLPVFPAESMNHSLPRNNLDTTSSLDLEIKEGNGSCDWKGDELQMCSDVLKDGGLFTDKKEGKFLRCSVRDLMRKKRCYRIESPGLETLEVGPVVFEQGNDCQDNRSSPISKMRFNDDQMECPNGNACCSESLGATTLEAREVFCKETRNDDHASGIIYCPISQNASNDEKLKFQRENASSNSVMDLCSEASHVKSKHQNPSMPDKVPVIISGSIGQSMHPDEKKGFSDGDLTYGNGQQKKTLTQRQPDILYEVCDGGSKCLSFENLSARLLGRGSGSLVNNNSEFLGIHTKSDPVEVSGLTFFQKPPVIEGEVACMSSPPGLPGGICKYNKENHEETLGGGSYCSQYLPFFHEKNLEEKYVQRNKNFHQDVVMGIPIHYQNDGSHLFMLTPAISPPSAASVNEWLLLEDTTNSGKYTVPTLPGPSSPKNSSENLVSSQYSPTSHCNKPLMKSVSELDWKRNWDLSDQQSKGTPVEKKPSRDNSETILLNERNIFDTVSSASQDLSQISGPEGKIKLTPLSQMGFRDPASVGNGQQLTLLNIEVQAESRSDLRPDPRFDAINVIILAFQDDSSSELDVYALLRCSTEPLRRNIDGISGCRVFLSSEEMGMFSHLIKIICSYDPDIIMGWDIQGGSLGFLAERAAHLGIGLLNKISRTPFQDSVSSSDLEVSQKGLLSDVVSEPSVTDPSPENAIIGDEWGRTQASGIHIGGRIVLNIWRIMRGEVKLNMYTAEAVAEAVLRLKIPSIQYKVLTSWFSSGPELGRYRCIEYILERAKLNFQIMNQLDLINRTSELARVFGIDFFSVLSRGSQYRVESMLLRLAHTQNYLVISPGIQQVASQPAMECLPLVMEPESGFYVDPVVVLDFQSLYPSMIIAYNLCFCTCLGKVTPSKENALGVSSYSPDPNVLRSLKREALVTPNGVMYVPTKVRRGVLPRLLEEILSTRIMVKRAMKKLSSSQRVLHRIFNARQLALKLIANVTYGYTAAGFSGRMPCAELADSIVQCGRRTLEKAILLVNANDMWKARVIYGDTDSMFVLLKGRSLKEAFEIGNEIASAVTAMNPNPVTLKMEKVYSPCFLLTKKRYVGYSYENPDQTKPLFDAKGIETVRRDNCGVVSKMMEQSLRLFFEQQDITQVKDYVLRQWTRILTGRVSLQDFIFAKEVRLGTYSAQAASLPPAAIVACKAMRNDPRAEPRYAERIPYVVVHGEPGARLVDLVVDPLDLLAIDSPYRLNDMYYIRKQIIPVLQRIFGLVGADLNQWFSGMPRLGRETVCKRNFQIHNALNLQRSRIDYYYLSKHCVLCGDMVHGSVHFCGKCSKNEVATTSLLVGKTSKLEKEMHHLAEICRQCGGGDWLVENGVKCTSLACSLFFERRKVQKELCSLSAVAAKEGFYPRCMVEWF